MININTFRNNLLNTLNRWASGTIPPSRQNDFLEQASIELLTEKYLSATQNQKLDDDLSAFHKSVNLPVTTPVGANYGLVEFPTDYVYYWSGRAFFSGTEDKPESCGCPDADNSACDARKNLVQEETPIQLLPIVKEVRVTKVDAGRWASVLNHRTKFPTLDRPVCTEWQGGLKIAPRNLNVVTLDYYVLPVKAIYGYSVVQNPLTNVPYYQYDPTTSTNILWGAQLLNELTDRVMKLAGVYLNNPSLFGMADNLKNTRV